MAHQPTDVKNSTSILGMWVELTIELVKEYRRTCIVLLIAAVLHFGQDTFWLLSKLDTKHIVVLVLVAVTTALTTALVIEGQRGK